MLWNALIVKGYAIEARDGRIGTVSDFLFDDKNWEIRWLIVDTGSWMLDRKVLLPPSVLGDIHAAGHEFLVNLTMEQVRESPDIDTQQPVSRQMEANIYDYYGQDSYWGGVLDTDRHRFADNAGFAKPDRGSVLSASAFDEQQIEGDPHLRSIESVRRYSIQASDGEIGHVSDFLIEDGSWSIRYLVVDTRNWWPENRVLMPAGSVKAIDWALKSVYLDADRRRVKESPAYDASAMVDEAYDHALLKYYGIKLNEARSTFTKRYPHIFDASVEWSRNFVRTLRGDGM